MKKYDTSTLLSFILFFLMFSGCTSISEQPERINHERMVAMLDSIDNDARNDPLKYSYANRYRLIYLDSLVQANPGIPQLQYQYALEYQISKDIEKSIPILLDLEEGVTDPRAKLMIDEGLAISYLRLAINQNCIENYTPSNCILPFDEEAVHTSKQLVQSSIRHLRRLLAAFPDDYNYHWLYNIAHIANGSYPDDVTPDYLIDGLQQSEKFPSDLDIPFFQNTAMMKGIGDSRISGSACVEDFNGNGHLDIFATSYGMGHEAILYLSDGNGNFSNKSAESGLTGITGGLNIECADINNSGFVDILILRGAWLAQNGEHPNSLLRNNGDGTFTDITVSSGLLELKPTQVAAFADINHNGYLDIFIGNESESPWQDFFVENSDSESEEEPSIYPSSIFLNNGDETFTRYQSLNGFELNDFVKGAAWGDINNNGFPDLYVSVMGRDNKLFVHRGLDEKGMPMFEEIGRQAGVQNPLFGFPVWFFDYNNNGLDDILVITYDIRVINQVAAEIARERLELPVESEFSRLYKNMGDETFQDITAEAGLNRVMFGMGANFGDVNNSGYPDIYIGTGAPNLTSIVPNRLFINNRGENFLEATAYSGTGHLQKGHGISFADFNNNGSLDFYAVMGGAYEGDYYHNVLFQNQSNFGNWISLKLEGTTANRQAIGARIEVVIHDENGPRSVFRTVSTGGSFGANNSRAHVGLGNAESIEKIIIKWPGVEGDQIVENPEINRVLEIRQAE